MKSFFYAQLTKIRKVMRFVCIYGPLRTYAKVAGRTRTGMFRYPVKKSLHQDIALIGCGQFAFSTIAYYLVGRFGSRIRTCFDINYKNALTLSRFYRVPGTSSNVGELLDDPLVKYVYIASNHASHTEYAVMALSKGKHVFVEKPVCVSLAQLSCLSRQVKKSGSRIYAGYNRPFSPAVRILKTKFNKGAKPVTISCFVSGHMIEENHWYRKPDEGTRICGNLGHWLDLTVHILSWHILPDKWRIHIAYGNLKVPDDNLSISLTSCRGDLINIILSSRCEPFEGVSEHINIQYDDKIVMIDDFRKMLLWEKEKKETFRFRPKDVGHKNSILQPFVNGRSRWHEVEMSSLLMLCIKEMVLAKSNYCDFSFSKEKNRLRQLVENPQIK